MFDRVLLDANAILTAAFVPESWSRYPSGWGGVVSQGQFAMIHLPGVLWLYYDAADKQWVAGNFETHVRETLAEAKPSLQAAPCCWCLFSPAMRRG